MRHVLAALLLLWGSVAYAEPINFEAMLEVCGNLDILEGESPVLCRDAVQKTQRQHPIFKDAGREHRAHAGDKEYEQRWLQQSNILSGLYNALKVKYPKAWGARQKPHQKAAN